MIDSFKGKYAFLSNFHPSPFNVDNRTFKTVEHLFQACKVNTLAEFEAIAKANTAAEAKKLGRKFSIRPDWEDVKVFVMAQGIWAKFSQNQDLRRLLLKTGNEPLEEGNYWHDNIWGNCRCDKCKDKPGKNALGLLLMSVRTTFHITNMFKND